MYAPARATSSAAQRLSGNQPLLHLYVIPNSTLNACVDTVRRHVVARTSHHLVCSHLTASLQLNANTISSPLPAPPCRFFSHFIPITCYTMATHETTLVRLLLRVAPSVSISSLSDISPRFSFVPGSQPPELSPSPSCSWRFYNNSLGSLEMEGRRWLHAPGSASTYTVPPFRCCGAFSTVRVPSTISFAWTNPM